SVSDLHSDSASVLHTRTTSNPELRMNSNNMRHIVKKFLKLSDSSQGNCPA
ncbi:hypothetical protein PRIPAC_75766, partial [Pristionchus pacificus]